MLSRSLFSVSVGNHSALRWACFEAIPAITVSSIATVHNLTNPTARHNRKTWANSSSWIWRNHAIAG